MKTLTLLVLMAVALLSGCAVDHGAGRASGSVSGAGSASGWVSGSR